MFARKLSSDGKMRCPAPWRARNATRRPRSMPVKTGAAPLEMFRDRRIRGCRLEQLEARLTHREKVRPDALRRDLFSRFDVEAERIAVERQRRPEILHRDADMIENGSHACCESCL